MTPQSDMAGSPSQPYVLSGAISCENQSLFHGPNHDAVTLALNEDQLESGPILFASN